MCDPSTMNIGMSIASASPEMRDAEHRSERARGEASIRGGLYRVFSLAFLYPSPEVVSLFRDPELPEVLAGFATASASLELALVEEMAAYLRSAEFPSDIARLGNTYHALFHLEGGVSLYEATYRGAHEFQWAEILADLNGFYRAFGVEPVRERPDHLSVELEFMYVLALKEIRARDEDEHLRITRDAERAFLRDHLAVWVPAFARAMRRRAREVGVDGGGFYGHLLTWLERFLESECARWGVAARAEASAPMPCDDADDEAFACPWHISCGDVSAGYPQAFRRWEIPEGGEEP
ncbi:Selenate reductase assembly chaperone protein [bacterium HR08]|nr:Selenate reductase assembly chaperone protein [bacterium HR08]